jgi:hypothetical protein
LTRELAITADDIQRIDVSVPEWGGVIAVRVMTALEREQYETMLNEQQKRGETLNIRASLVAWCAVDAHGKRLFSADDIAALSTKSAVAVNRLFDAARILNAMTSDEANDMKKNSAPISNGVSASD